MTRRTAVQALAAGTAAVAVVGLTAPPAEAGFYFRFRFSYHVHRTRRRTRRRCR